MINRNLIVTFFLFVFVGIQAGTDFSPPLNSLSLGFDSPSVFEVNSLTVGTDSPQFPMVAGVSTSNDLCPLPINIIIN